MPPIRSIREVQGALAVFLAGSCALVNLYSTQPLFREIMADLGGSPLAGGWTITATTFAVALVAPVAGLASDRLGRKKVAVPAILAMAGATLLCAAASTLGGLLVCRFLQGMFIPFLFTAMVAYLAEEYGPTLAPRMMGIYVSGSVFGGFLGRFLPGVVAFHAGWRCAFLVLAGYALAAAGVIAAWLAPEARFQPRPAAGTFGQLLRRRGLLATCLAGGTLLFVQVASFTFAGLYLAAPPFALSSRELGAIFAVFLAGIVATPLAGRAVARWGPLRTFTGGCLASGLGLCLCLLPRTAAVVAGLGLCSTGIFSCQVCAAGEAARAAGSAKSSGVGLYLMAYYLSGGLGAVAPAPVFHRWGWPGCVPLLLLVLGSGLGTVWLAWRR